MEGRMTKFYIASTLDNAEEARKLAAKVKVLGWEQTYDWTEHGSVQHYNQQQRQAVAMAELDGVLKADIVFMLFPAKRGSHVELGAALASGSWIMILASADQLLKDGRTCAFYHHPQVLRDGPLYTYITKQLKLDTREGEK